MPTFLEVIQGMRTHLDGTISGVVDIVVTPEMPLGNQSPPYATVAPGAEGDGVHNQNDYRHPKAGTLFITAWVKPYDEYEAEATERLLNTSDLLTKRAVSATVGMHFNITRIDAPVKVDTGDGILVYRTATVTFFWRED